MATDTTGAWTHTQAYAAERARQAVEQLVGSKNRFSVGAKLARWLIINYNIDFVEMAKGLQINRMSALSARLYDVEHGIPAPIAEGIRTTAFVFQYEFEFCIIEAVCFFEDEQDWKQYGCRGKREHKTGRPMLLCLLKVLPLDFRFKDGLHHRLNPRKAARYSMPDRSSMHHYYYYWALNSQNLVAYACDDADGFLERLHVMHDFTPLRVADIVETDFEEILKPSSRPEPILTQSFVEMLR